MGMSPLQKTFTNLERWIRPAALDVLEDYVLPILATGTGALSLSWMGATSKTNAAISVSFGFLANTAYSAFKQKMLAERNNQTVAKSSKNKMRTALIIQGKSEPTRVFASNLQKLAKCHKIKDHEEIRTDFDLNQVLSNAGKLDTIWIRGTRYADGIRLRGAPMISGRSHTIFNLLKEHLKPRGSLIIEPGGSVDFAKSSHQQIPQARVFYTEKSEAVFEVRENGTPYFIDPKGQDVTRISCASG